MATKEKRKKVRDHYPPAEIRENTKARRAWLAAKAAELNAQPGVEAKVVGQGSYQTVAEWHVTQVEGRARLRGVCQCCGGSQVVQGGLIVLHGYQRPGWGTIYGRCPGVERMPLETEKRLTEMWRDNEAALVEKYAAQHTAAQAAEAQALTALRGDVEPGAYREMPRVPHLRYNATADQVHQAREDYLAAMKAWALRFPLHAAYQAAQEATRKAYNNQRKAEAARDHFQRLLDSGVHGTELTVEVVA